MNADERANETAAFLAINPMGAMPVLESDDGTYLAEAMAICRYIEELHPEPNRLGITTLERALVEMWNRPMDFEIMQSVREAFQNLSPFWVGRREQLAKYGKLAQKAAIGRMTWLNNEPAKQPFIADDRYTVADITARCGLLLGKHTGTLISENLTNLTRWFAEVSSRPTARA